MSQGRIPVSTRCDEEVWQQARAAAVGMQYLDPSYSLTRLVEDALTAEVERLAAEHRAGEPWPEVEQLRRGRRVTS